MESMEVWNNAIKRIVVKLQDNKYNIKIVGNILLQINYICTFLKKKNARSVFC